MKIPTFEMPDLDRAPSPTRKALDQNRISRLPPFPCRAVCENCGGRLDTSDDFQESLKLCRECLRNYANIGGIIEKHTEAKIRRNYRGKDSE